MAGIQQLLLASKTPLVPDEYFEYTTLLLPGNGTNGAQNNTFLDSSTNNFTITRNGNTTQGTFSPFSQTGWGNYFDGTGDYLTVADNAALQMGSGDFTIEYWWYPTSLTGYQSPIDKGYTGAGGLLFQTGNGDGKIIIYAAGSAVITASAAVTLNAWNHMALVRNGTSLVLYLNGASVGSATNSTNFNSTAILGVGSSATSSPLYPVNGYMSNVRFVKGTAVYTSSFTPSTTPLTAITNTSLLTCQSNRFIDNSSNAFAITRNGDVSVQAFSPFNPTAAWSAATYGGSGYFDGSGDYLTVPDNAAFDFGSGDFTVEAFFYPTSTGDRVIVSTWSSPDTNSAWEIIYYVGTLYCQVASSSTVTTLTTSSYPLNQWNHIAMVRTGNTLSAYLNGTRFATTAYSSTINNGNNGPSIGARAGGSSFPYLGYLSGVRVIKGAGPYDATSSSLTVPTAPLTAITNTQLLTNFTNAGIYDATSKNDLETVGNAQISTTQSKFGGSSMLFDGTGDWLLSNVATANLYAFGTGDFTVEMWVRFAAIGAGDVHHFYDNRPASTDGAYVTLRTNASAQLEYIANSAVRITGATLTTGAWYHIAVCRSGTSTKLFVDGVQSGSTYTDSIDYLSPASRPVVGASGYHLGTLNGFNGYINDLRITKGIARYTTGFTPPTTAFPVL